MWIEPPVDAASPPPAPPASARSSDVHTPAHDAGISRLTRCAPRSIPRTVKNVDAPFRNANVSSTQFVRTDISCPYTR